MITLYGLKSCDACKRARAALEAEGRAVAFVDIRAEADLAAKAPQWLAALGAEALINRRSTTWRGLSEAERSAADGEGAAALVIAHPALIKRPVLESGAAVSVGWPPKPAPPG